MRRQSDAAAAAAMSLNSRPRDPAPSTRCFRRRAASGEAMGDRQSQSAPPPQTGAPLTRPPAGTAETMPPEFSSGMPIPVSLRESRSLPAPSPPPPSSSVSRRATTCPRSVNFHGVAHEVPEDLAEPERIGDDDGGNRWSDLQRVLCRLQCNRSIITSFEVCLFAFTLSYPFTGIYTIKR